MTDVSDWITQAQLEEILGKKLDRRIEAVLTADDRYFFSIGAGCWLEAAPRPAMNHEDEAWRVVQEAWGP